MLKRIKNCWLPALIFCLSITAAEAQVGDAVPISGLPNAGLMQQTDVVPIVRAGVTMKAAPFIMPANGSILVSNSTAAPSGLIPVNGKCIFGSMGTWIAGNCITAIDTLTFGAHLTSAGTSFDGTANVTIASDATSANTVSTIMARDSSGNFAAGKATLANLTVTNPIFGTIIGADPKMYLAVCDGSTDDSTPIQNWLNAGATGIPLTVGNEICAFQTVPSLSNPTGLYVNGSGPNSSIFKYTGAGTTSDLFTIGNTAGPYTTGIILNNFSIVSNTVMTGGTALHLEKVQYSFVNVATGTPASGHLYNGIWDDKGSFNNYLSSQTYASNDGWRGSDCLDPHLNHLISQGFTTGNGVHIGGGCGGVVTEHTDEFGYNIGVLIDTSLSAAGNNQIFISPDSLFDSNTSANGYVNDSYATNKSLFVDGWFATTTSGNAFVVINWNGGQVYSSLGRFYNSQGGGNGLVLEDASARYSFGTSVLIASNTGYGIAGTVPITIYSTATPYSNSSGSYNGNITIATSAAPVATLTMGTHLAASATTFNGSAAATILSDATNANTASTIVARDGSGNFTAGTITAALTGNADTATKLATARTLAMTGDVAWTSTAFDGSASTSNAGTLATVNSQVGAYGSATVIAIPTVNAKGLITGVATATATPAFTSITGSVAASQMPALTGDVTTSAGAVATTLATVNSQVGAYGSATVIPSVTVNGKGLVTAVATNTATPAVGSITGLGTGIATALGVNTGSAGAPVLFNGAGGTPSSLTGTNISGTAASLTAGNVTTNANLTGPITSSGNATSIASQTGSGTTFVVQTSPTINTSETVATGAFANVIISNAAISTYNNITLNGSTGSTTMMGLLGGASGDPTLYIMSAAGGAYDFDVAGSVVASVRANGHIATTGAIPTITTCGSGALTAGSTDSAGQITGITATTACTITFGSAFGAASSCSFTTSTGIAAGGLPNSGGTAVTTTMALFTGSLGYICSGHQ